MGESKSIRLPAHYSLLSKFIDDMLELIVCESITVREAVKDLIGSEIRFTFFGF